MAAACCLAAARSGHLGAQKQMARMYLAGCGVTASEQDAIYWCRLAASQGDEYARQAVEAYRNSHLPPVYANCEECLGKGQITRTCRACGGSGTYSQTVTTKSIKTCSCGWQMVNGRCPNCGRTVNSSYSTTSACPSCRGSGHETLNCQRCGGAGQVRVSGPAQASFAQVLNRPDPTIVLGTATRPAPVRLHPFRAGVNRGVGL